MIIETEILVYLLYNEEKRKYYCFIGISQNHSIGFIFDKVVFFHIVWVNLKVKGISGMS